MPGARPELIFVEGPQENQRVVLMNNICIAGRSPQVDVVIREEFVSRNQLQFIFTRDGWIVENLVKSSKMEIDGKFYKAGKKILLDSGDTIKIGMETKLLFIAPEDDPAVVLLAYREAHPKAAPISVPVPVPSAKPIEEPVRPMIDLDAQPTEFIEIPTGEMSIDSPEKEMTEFEMQAQASAKKKKLYMILGIGWLAILGGVGLMLMSVETGVVGGNSMPREWTRAWIKKAISSPLTRAHVPDEDRILMDKADNYFAIRTAQKKNLYRAVLHYRLAMAYRVGDNAFLPSLQQGNYTTALTELILLVTQEYEDMIQRERNDDWRAAYNSAERIHMLYLPRVLATDERDKKVLIFLGNVDKHQDYIASHMGKKK